MNTRRALIPMLLAVVQICIGAPDEAVKQSMEAGQTALTRRDFPAAKAAYDAAIAAAEQAGDQALTAEALRKAAGVSRLLGNFGESEQLLAKAVPFAVRAHGDNSEMLATVLSELAAAQRAQRKLKEAMLTLDSCVRTRQAAGSKPIDTVRDLAMLARTHQEIGDLDRAAKRWREALDLWDSALPQDSLEILGAVDALAGLHRDNAEYEAAEALLRRSLATREATFGPDSSELISTLDSLSYTLFGLKKYADAEPFYQRLLSIWKASAGEDHPMVALTLEKMTEFYAAQQRYTDAEPVAAEALAIRTVAHLRSLHQSGRVTLMQAKLAEADAIYKQAVRIGDDAGMSDEIMDPMLRVQAQILKALKRPAEAAVVEKRIKTALLRNTNLRPSPVKAPAAK